MGVVIKEAITDEEIKACWPVIKELRPHVSEDTLVNRVKKQQSEGFHLMYVEDNSIVASILGYRIQNYLYSGKTLYIDDLCTLPVCKGKGHGGALLDWVIQFAREQKCDTVSLDSGYTRNDAHRLYLNKGFTISCHHFCIDLRK